MIVLAAAGGAAMPAQVSALDDPQRSVFAAFPEADAYQVIVRAVDDQARKRIEACLPFRVHFDELGAHSLYVALRGRRPIGMVYAQHEESAFGLAAVEWAITLDMRVSSFRFQRVRSKHRRALERSEFVRTLKERTRVQLAARLNKDGRLAKAAKGVDDDAQELASAVVRSGVKSLAVLEVVWGSEIAKLRDRAVGLRAFPEAIGFRRIWPPASGDVEARPDVVMALRVFDAGRRYAGAVCDVQMDSGRGMVVVRWTIDRAGKVTDADVPPSAPRTFRATCSEAKGRDVRELGRRTDVVGRALRSVGELLMPGARPVR